VHLSEPAGYFFEEVCWPHDLIVMMSLEIEEYRFTSHHTVGVGSKGGLENGWIFIIWSKTRRYSPRIAGDIARRKRCSCHALRISNGSPFQKTPK